MVGYATDQQVINLLVCRVARSQPCLTPKKLPYGRFLSVLNGFSLRLSGAERSSLRSQVYFKNLRRRSIYNSYKYLIIKQLQYMMTYQYGKFDLPKW
jgi:hypothetical protein